MPSALPWFPFYVTDFVDDERVIAMTEGELGIYIRLLCYGWKEGGVPTSRESLAKLARVPLKTLNKAWIRLAPLFLERDGRFYQSRQERIRDEQAAKRERLASNGRRGGRPKKNAVSVKAEEKPSFIPASPTMNQQESPDKAGLKPDESHSESESESDRETSSSTPSGAGSDDEDAKDVEIDRSSSPAKEFARWFVETGLATGLVQQHVGFSETLSKTVNAWAQDCSGVVATYGVPECRARAQRLFAACRESAIRKRPVDMGMLVLCWDWPVVASAPMPVEPIKEWKSPQQRMAEEAASYAVAEERQRALWSAHHKRETAVNRG